MTAKIDGGLLEPSRTLKINGNTINYLKVDGKEFWRNVQPLRITKQPTDKYKKDKETLSLSCAVDSGRSTFVKYQWYRNGKALSGETGSSLSRKVNMGDNGASWQCHITNDVGTVKTRAAKSVVKPLDRGTLKGVVKKKTLQGKPTCTVEGSVAGSPVILQVSRLDAFYARNTFNIIATNSSLSKFGHVKATVGGRSETLDRTDLTLPVPPPKAMDNVYFLEMYDHMYDYLNGRVGGNVEISLHFVN